MALGYAWENNSDMDDSNYHRVLYYDVYVLILEGDWTYVPGSVNDPVQQAAGLARNIEKATHGLVRPQIRKTVKLDKNFTTDPDYGMTNWKALLDNNNECAGWLVSADQLLNVIGTGPDGECDEVWLFFETAAVGEVATSGITNIGGNGPWVQRSAARSFRCNSYQMHRRDTGHESMSHGFARCIDHRHGSGSMGSDSRTLPGTAQTPFDFFMRHWCGTYDANGGTDQDRAGETVLFPAHIGNEHSPPNAAAKVKPGHCMAYYWAHRTDADYIWISTDQAKFDLQAEQDESIDPNCADYTTHDNTTDKYQTTEKGIGQDLGYGIGNYQVTNSVKVKSAAPLWRNKTRFFEWPGWEYTESTAVPGATVEDVSNANWNWGTHPGGGLAVSPYEGYTRVLYNMWWIYHMPHWPDKTYSTSTWFAGYPYLTIHGNWYDLIFNANDFDDAGGFTGDGYQILAH